jgi:hypothetical protein
LPLKPPRGSSYPRLADLATTMGYTHLVDDALLALVEVDEERALKALATG